MLKVGLFTTEFLPVWGGVAAYCINLVRALSNQVEFHVFTTSRNADTGYSIKDHYGFINNITIHQIIPAKDIFISSIRFQGMLVRKLSHMIQENRLDLVHAGGPLADQAVRLFRKTQIPYILTYHSTMWGQKAGIVRSSSKFRNMDTSEKATMILYPFLSYYEYISLKRTTNIIAVSDTVKAELQDRYGYKNRISVIPNGIDTEYFKPKERKDTRKRVIFSGRLIALKGLSFLIQAVPIVLKEHSDAVFVFAGAGDKTPYVKMLFELGVSERNFQFSYIDYRDMPDYYNSGTVMVLPSLHESFPMSILEAMSCGIPVVSSKVGDINKMVKEGETGYLVDAGDYRKLAQQISAILSDCSLQKKLGNNARNIVLNNFSITMMGKKTLEFYSQVIAKEQ